MEQQQRWERLGSKCQVTRCQDSSEVSVSVQLSTPGGRKGRTQVRATSVRLCSEHLDALGNGTNHAVLAQAIQKAIKKVRE